MENGEWGRGPVRRLLRWPKERGHGGLGQDDRAEMRRRVRELHFRSGVSVLVMDQIRGLHGREGAGDSQVSNIRDGR